MSWSITKNPGVGETDLTAVVRPLSKFRVRKREGAQTLSFRITDKTGAAEIAAGDVIRVEHDTAEVFEGLVRISTIADMGLAGVRVIDVECVDYNILVEMDVIKTAASRSVVESDKERLAWLVSTYGTKGVVAGAFVQEILATMPPGEDGVPRQDLGRRRLSAAIASITKLSGGKVYVDSDKELHHYLDDEGLTAPFALSSSPDGMSTLKLRSFALTRDAIDQVHRVLIIGDGVEVVRELDVMPDAEDVVEDVINDSDITSVEQAEAAGDAFLAAHGAVAMEGSAQVMVAGAEPGQVIQVTHSLYGMVAEEFRIVSVDVLLATVHDVRYDISFGRSPADMASLVGGVATAVESVTAVAEGAAISLADLSAAGANLIENSSFENADASFWAVGANWVFGYAPGGGELAFDHAKTARATAAAAVIGDLVTDPIAVVRADDYWLSAWSFVRAWTSGTAVAEVREYDSGDVLLATTPFASVAAAQAAWTRFSVKMGTNDQVGRTAFQAATSYVRIAFRSDGAATMTWDVDGVQVERGGIITAFAPRPAELVDESVGTTKIADDAVTTEKIIANAIVAGKIAASAITTEKLDALAVTADKIAAGAVVATKIAAQSIVVGNLAQNPNNEISNGGFDFVAEGGPAVGVYVGEDAPFLVGWTPNAVTGGLTYAAWTTTNAHGGGACLLLKYNAGGSIQYKPLQFAPVMGGRKYHLSYWVRGTAGNTAPAAVVVEVHKITNAGIQIPAFSIVVRTVGSSTTWTQYTTILTIPDDAISLRFTFSVTGSTGDIVAVDDAETYPVDYDINHASGKVVIDSSGITITNGALTLSDQFGQNVLTGAGFGASWLDFIASGFYNGHFAVGTTTEITAATEVSGGNSNANYLASLSADIPYWVVSAESGAGTLKRIADSTAVGSFALQWAGSEDATVYQDVPILPGREYRVIVSWRYTNSSSEFAQEHGVHFRDSTHGAIGSEINQGLSYTGTLTAYAPQQVIMTGIAPANARYLRVLIRHSRTSGSPTIWLNTVTIIAGLSTLRGSLQTGGTSFPASPATNDLFYRTDHGLFFFYDGTRWLGPEEQHDLAIAGATVTTNSDWIHAPFVNADIKLVGFACASLVLTTNDGSNYWTVACVDIDGSGSLGTTHGSYSTASDGTTAYVGHAVANSDVVTYATPRRGLVVKVTKTASPGALYVKMTVRFRRIYT